VSESQRVVTGAVPNSEKIQGELGDEGTGWSVQLGEGESKRSPRRKRGVRGGRP